MLPFALVVANAATTASPTVVPTLAPSRKPTPAPTTSLPTRIPSAKPTTVAPTAKPTTALPTVSPTVQPTAAPLPSVDCRSGCSLLQHWSVSERTLLRKIILPAAFTVSFSLTVPRLLSAEEVNTVPNLFPVGLYEEVTQQQLLAVRLKHTVTVQGYCGGASVILSGLVLDPLYTEVPTRFTFRMAGDILQGVSSANPTQLMTATMPPFDSANRVYGLYADTPAPGLFTHVYNLTVTGRGQAVLRNLLVLSCANSGCAVTCHSRHYRSHRFTYRRRNHRSADAGPDI